MFSRLENSTMNLVESIHQGDILAVGFVAPSLIKVWLALIFVY